MKFNCRPITSFYTVTLAVFICNFSDGQIPDSVNLNIKFTYQTVPSFTRNIDRIDLIYHDNIEDGWWINYTNSNIKNYCDLKFENVADYSVGQMYQNLNNDLQTTNNSLLNNDSKQNINNNSERDIVYSLASVKLFTSQSEDEMNLKVREISRDLIEMGYDDFEYDFMPFVARILAEHRKVFYQDNRVKAFSIGAQGIVSAMDIIDVHRTPKSGLTAGVCRDASEFAFRIMRQSFQVYYNEVKGEDYNPDDYLFLQCWATPLSQHVTVLMVDPENTRNGYDLDWGRVYKRESQEGLETPNNVGTEIRLWKFDPAKNHTIPLLLIKTDKGQLLDKYSLNQEEFESFNSMFYKTFYSDLKYEKQINEQYYWNSAVGKLNDNCYYALATVIRNGKEHQLLRYINYNDKIVLQPHYYENNEVQEELIPWKEWDSSHNLGLVTRYIARISSKEIKLGNNFSFGLFSNSQISLLLSASKFYTDDRVDQKELYTTGDGNIYTTYGGRLSYKSKSEKIRYDLVYQRRNYLTPKEVRLLSPNPSVLVENARLVCAANNLISSFNYNWHSTGVRLNTVYEYDILKTQLLQNEVSVYHQIHNKDSYSFTYGFNHQLAGYEYYWYPLNKNYFQLGYNFSKYGLQTSIFMCQVKSHWDQIGFSLQKYF